MTRDVLLAHLRVAWLSAAVDVAEARAIYRALDRNWITCAAAATWAIGSGILCPPPAVPDYWRQAAAQYRRDRYGAGSILEQGSAG